MVYTLYLLKSCSLIGYYARVTSIRMLLKRFLEITSCNCQVINLGAGFDTTYWLLLEDGLVPYIYIEVDFEAVTSRKCYYISKNKKALLDPLSKYNNQLSTSMFNYNIV